MYELTPDPRRVQEWNIRYNSELSGGVTAEKTLYLIRPTFLRLAWFDSIEQSHRRRSWQRVHGVRPSNFARGLIAMCMVISAP